MKKFSVIFLVSLLIAVFAYQYYQSQIESPIKEELKEISFVVVPGDNAKVIAEKLEQAGLIKSAEFFQFFIWQNKNQDKLQAGEYVLNTGMSIKDISDNLVSGKVNNKERTIKILEGWTIDDINNYFVKENVVNGNEFLDLAKLEIGNWKLEIDKPEFLSSAPKNIDLEGYLFPDTYRIFKDASAEDILNKFLTAFNNKLSPDLRLEIEKQGKTVHEVITLASIIEKEVRSEDDMALVSGILQKRLEIGMSLEVDSTINYITGKNDPSVEYADLQIDSPYNTYKNYGLPPGPISNPGLASIKAAIYPTESEYLFYLNRQDTGETIFSKTYDEHLANKYKYLK